MGIYQSIYNLIMQYIYGNATATGDMELVATLIATAGSIFVVAMPFVLVYKVVQMIMGR